MNTSAATKLLPRTARPEAKEDSPRVDGWPCLTNIRRPRTRD